MIQGTLKLTPVVSYCAQAPLLPSPHSPADLHTHCSQRIWGLAQLLLVIMSSHWQKMTALLLTLWLIWILFVPIWHPQIADLLVIQFGDWFLPRLQDMREALSYVVMSTLRTCPTIWTGLVKLPGAWYVWLSPGAPSVGRFWLCRWI